MAFIEQEECHVDQGDCLVDQEECLVDIEECLVGQEECLVGQQQGLVGRQQGTIVMASDHQILILYDQKVCLDHHKLEFINENIQKPSTITNNH